MSDFQFAFFKNLLGAMVSASIAGLIFGVPTWWAVTRGDSWVNVLLVSGWLLGWVVVFKTWVEWEPSDDS